MIIISNTIVLTRPKSENIKVYMFKKFKIKILKIKNNYNSIPYKVDDNYLPNCHLNAILG